MKKKYQLGDVEITRVREIVFPAFDAKFLFPEWNPGVVEGNRRWLQPGCVNASGDAVTISIHTWVVRTPRHTILIDTGIGNGRNRRIPLFNQLDTPYLDRLAEAGVRPEAVDYVFCTHLHSDHVGWNTRRDGERWVPTFPNARYVFPEDELAFSRSDAFQTGYAAGVFEDSIAPIVDAGLVELIPRCGGRFLDDFTFYPTPGHTPGHMSIGLASGGEAALFTGDVVHNPVQIYQPAWNSAFCETPDRALQSRQWMLEHVSARRALVLTAHFPDSSAGYVTRTGDGFDWHFA